LARAYQGTVGDYLNSSLSFERSFMAVPLMLKDRIIGLLGLTSARPDYYTPHHGELALAIAQLAAIAIENARLYEQAQEVAVVEERQRLSRELHDSVSQALYSIALGAKTARALADRDPGRVAEPLDFVLAQAERGLAEMRALIFELRPEALEQDGLVSALAKQVDALRARHRLQVEVMLGEEPEVALPAKDALYRIAQEALQNVIKHANAASVQVRLDCQDGVAVLEIRDDGMGFDADQSFPGHLGLTSMAERAVRLGGTVDIASEMGQGTRVYARIPLSPQA
jgi:signal transduction histidine kinase